MSLSVSFSIVYIRGLSLGTTDILGQKMLHVGADLWIVGCLAAPTASTPYIAVAPPPVMTTKVSLDIATCAQGAELPPIENHWATCRRH